MDTTALENFKVWWIYGSEYKKVRWSQGSGYNHDYIHIYIIIDQEELLWFMIGLKTESIFLEYEYKDLIRKKDDWVCRSWIVIISRFRIWSRKEFFLLGSEC